MFEDLNLQRVADVTRRLNEIVREVEARPTPAVAPAAPASRRPSDDYRLLANGLDSLHAIFAERR
ncbi:hypothetical protein [Aureimonas pseudogalii]|uniref:Uncharacterized protein n=1 Tax=Aureimonas pseudogalii TaxID=1744844 RepID=A0A7W6ED58_9HYPH|nr:hypothetical protein [Aureimonas pseudogalii]MBB3997107.1 hypothetical protein [Aureimonas pseudogalii]